MKILDYINRINDSVVSFDFGILLFRILVSVQLITVPGLKKIGIGTKVLELATNHYNLPSWLNDTFATASYLVFPLFVIVGYYTRLAAIPILTVTLSGYFIVHWKDAFYIRDVPFMYSISCLLIAICGPGKYSYDNFLRR